MQFNVLYSDKYNKIMYFCQQNNKQEQYGQKSIFDTTA